MAYRWIRAHSFGFQLRAIFSKKKALLIWKKKRKQFLPFERTKSQEFNLENQYYKVASRW